jgi:hypothetical protein
MDKLGTYEDCLKAIETSADPAETLGKLKEFFVARIEHAKSKNPMQDEHARDAHVATAVRARSSRDLGRNSSLPEGAAPDASTDRFSKPVLGL